MMTMVDAGDDYKDKDLFHNMDYVDDDDDDDLHGNLPMRFTMLHNPIYMGLWDMGINRVPTIMMMMMMMVMNSPTIPAVPMETLAWPIRELLST